MRFDYNPPSPIELIADGQSVVVRDRNFATQDLYPLSQTPLRFLLADRIDLLRNTNLIGVYADDVFVTVGTEERQFIASTHRLMLMFGAQDYQLRQWTLTDPQGYDTTVAYYNLDTRKQSDMNMFRIRLHPADLIANSLRPPALAHVPFRKPVSTFPGMHYLKYWRILASSWRGL